MRASAPHLPAPAGEKIAGRPLKRVKLTNPAKMEPAAAVVELGGGAQRRIPAVQQQSVALPVQVQTRPRPLSSLLTWSWRGETPIGWCSTVASSCAFLRSVWATWGTIANPPSGALMCTVVRRYSNTASTLEVESGITFEQSCVADFRCRYHSAAALWPLVRLRHSPWLQVACSQRQVAGS